MILEDLVKIPRWSCQDPTMVLGKILSQSCQDSIIILPWSYTILARFHHDLTKIISKSCQHPIVIFPWSWRILSRFHYDLAKILSKSCQDPSIILPWSWKILTRSHHMILPRSEHDLTNILPKSRLGRSYCNLAMILEDLVKIQSCQDSIIILPWSWKILSRSDHDLAMIFHDFSWYIFLAELYFSTFISIGIMNLDQTYHIYHNIANTLS
jgi:hypothetical protein